MIASQDRIEFINILRALAIILVIISHYFSVFWLNRDITAKLILSEILSSDYPTPAYIKCINVFKISYGSLGVAIFFLISGFVIPFSFKRYSSLGFIISRVFRLFPSYIVGFSLTVIALIFSSEYWEIKFPYSPKEVFFHYIIGIKNIIDIPWIDGIMWTLEIEVIFYLICTLFASLLRQASKKIFIIPFILLILYYLTPYLEYNFPLLKIFKSFRVPFLIYMFIGVAMYYYYNNFINYKLLMVLITLFLSFYFYIQCVTINLFPVKEYLIALIIFTIFWYNRSAIESNFQALNIIADLSYALYIVHGVCGYVLIRILLDLQFLPITSLIITIIIIFNISYLIHKYIEYPSLKICKKLVMKFTSLN